MAALDWSQCSAVESVPGKVSGAWVLKGTRMPVSAIFGNLEAGANLDDIMEWYDGLDRGQVKAVIEFGGHSLNKAPARPVAKPQRLKAALILLLLRHGRGRALPGSYFLRVDSKLVSPCCRKEPG